MAAQNGNKAGDESTDSILVTAHHGERSASMSSASLSQSDKNNKWKTERCNLLNIAKICIKTLIDTSLKKGRSLDDDFAPLNQFFIVMEHVFRHGLKGKRSLLGYRKDFWSVLETMENRIASLKDMMSSVRSLPSIKTNVGRARAWIRVALMQKLLAEQVQAIIEGKHYITDLYESYAMMLNEDCVVISGLLVGLNVIDCNFDLKGEDLDSNSGVIDISLYLRDGNYLDKTSMDSEEANGCATVNEQKIEMVLDQKAYLEELNRSLSDSVSQLQNKVNHSQEKMKSLENELEVTKTNLREITEKKDQFEEENMKLKNEHQKSLKLAQADINIERETYQQSRSGLNEMYLQVKRQFDTEVQHRKDLQQELTVQIAMNQEKEVAMRLLEKDVHDKQDTLVSLRKQLEDVKKINIDLHNKWQKSVDELKLRSEKWNSMEEKCNSLTSEINEFENGMKEADLAKAQALETLAQMGFKMGDIESERHTLETNLKIEREWRSGMQTELEQEKERVKRLEKEMLQVSILKEENETMKKKSFEYEAKQAEQESALLEMADQLSKSQLHVDDMKEATAVLKEQVWQDEKRVGNCQQCEQAFSVARRKHHCRHCGGIYCGNCSDNTMPLPSSAKPVRVCDSCHDKLLARYKAI